MKNSDVDLTFRILGFVASVIIGILAIYGDKARNWISRKRLRLMLSQALHAKHDDTLKSEIYWHLKVENTHRYLPCRNVRVVLRQIFILTENGWDVIASTWEPNFLWDNENRLVTATKGEISQFVESNPQGSIQPVSLPQFGNLEGPTVGQTRHATIGSIHEDTPSSMTLALKNPSTRISHRFKDETTASVEIEGCRVLVRLQAVSDEVDSNELWLDIEPLGKWDSRNPSKVARVEKASPQTIREATKRLQATKSTSVQ